MESVRDGGVASVHSWELVTAVDGPGTRMTLFLSGCPLRCQYCHNPDTWKMKDGQITPIDEIVARLERYLPVFRATGGGLTVSGGEPLMQPAFVARLFAECRALGIHTTLDTSGYLGRRASDALLDSVDLVLLDVKSGLPATYREVTGRELAPTVEFGDRLAARGIAVWVRYVLVPGLTDAVDNVDAAAEIVSRWPNVERVEVLPFHQMGEDKWERLGEPYRLADVSPPTGDLQERVRGQFRSRGIETF
ncbi:pyruvate formate-lyase-activating protein [Conyzicola sp.]|uniref:pyruvate formate-lyase-activating protein n=1 Tax=Conyzicola sp. TaxID=1969404 RepID=UPI0039890FD5